MSSPYRGQTFPSDRFCVLGFLQAKPSCDSDVYEALCKGLERKAGDEQDDLWVELSPAFCIGKHDFGFALSGRDLASLDHCFYELLEAVSAHDSMVIDYTKLHLTELIVGDELRDERLPPIAFTLVKFSPSVHRSHRLIRGLWNTLDRVQQGVGRAGDRELAFRAFMSYGLHEAGLLFYGRSLRLVSDVLETLILDELVQFSNTIPLVRIKPHPDKRALIADSAYASETSTLTTDMMVALNPEVQVADVVTSIQGLDRDEVWSIGRVDYRFGAYDLGIELRTPSLGVAFNAINAIRFAHGLRATASSLRLELDQDSSRNSN